VLGGIQAVLLAGLLVAAFVVSPLFTISGDERSVTEREVAKIIARCEAATTLLPKGCPQSGAEATPSQASQIHWTFLDYMPDRNTYTHCGRWIQVYGPLSAYATLPDGTFLPNDVSKESTMFEFLFRWDANKKTSTLVRERGVGGQFLDNSCATFTG
jgi:hypothetical protein